MNEPTDLDELEGAYSIGNISIEPRSSISITNSGRSDEHKSIKSFTSSRLGLKTSTDSLRGSNGFAIPKPVLEGKRIVESLIGGHTSPALPALDTLVVSKRSTRNSVAPEPLSIPTRASSVRSDGSLGNLHKNPEGMYGDIIGNRKKYGIPNEDCIPTRKSSMRHNQRLSPSRHREKSHLSESSSNMEHNKSTSDHQPDLPEQTLQELPSELEEDSVNRRIKELKEQKLERERNSMETPTEFPSAPQTPDGSPATSPDPAPRLTTSICASVSREMTDEIEVHQLELPDVFEKGAPSPAIAQRSNGNSGIRARSAEATPAIATYSSAIPGDVRKRSSLALPTRSNSRLLKRFSRPMSPAPAEERITAPKSLQEARRIASHKVDESDLISNAVNEYLLSPRLSQKINHPQTGRVISFSEVGDPEGSVIFCCVGMGLTRFITAFYDELASTLKLRLVTPDRPGIGGSESRTDGLDTPLGWPDDVRAICQHLNITKFSILAHSAGAIYALATALRMPQHIRCRVHLLAPWIPPSQMHKLGLREDFSPAKSLPYSQRFLRSLPTTFFKAANSNFLSATSANATTSLPKSPRRSKRKSFIWGGAAASDIQECTSGGGRNESLPIRLHNSELVDFSMENRPPSRSVSNLANVGFTAQCERERRSAYDARLTGAIWDAATTGTNPAVDLLVCLERRQPIGFRYVDITRSVVIHHGSKDSRVPLDNVKWLGNVMRRCEVRVLEGEGHGLMASAGVMSSVLMEMAQEWSDWNRVVKGNGGMDRRVTNVI